MSGSPAGVLQRLLECEKLIPDPGASGAIAVDRDLGVVQLITAAAESRTMPNPAGPGIRCGLYLATDGGDCEVTFATAINAAGNTIVTFSAVGEFVELLSVETAPRTYVWRIVGSDGVALS